ncbi:MAG: integrase core domain-containing protein [Candidatus Aminicenantia bacterium]
MVKEEAKRRLKILEFFAKYGLEAAREAFGVSRSSIYRWRELLKVSGGDITVLNNHSRAPKRRRKMEVETQHIEFIKEIRERIPNIGKEKIKPLLDRYCEEMGIKKISASTIGRVIKRYNIYFLPPRLDSRGRMKVRKRQKRLRRKGYTPQKPGDLVQIDGITLFLDGIKRYILSAVDMRSRFAFSYLYERLTSKAAVDFMEKLENVAPFQIKKIQTDNGSEFLGEFDKYVKRKEITHYFIYPRHPQSNSLVERFNRTLGEEFVEWKAPHPEEKERFNMEMVNYLLFYNCERPHKSLDNLSPLQYLIKNDNFSNMLWTHTNS